MTWKEFKAEVDRQLKELEIPEEMQYIWYIDFHPDFEEKPVVHLDEELGMKIT